MNILDSFVSGKKLHAKGIGQHGAAPAGKGRRVEDGKSMKKLTRSFDICRACASCQPLQSRSRHCLWPHRRWSRRAG